MQFYMVTPQGNYNHYYKNHIGWLH